MYRPASLANDREYSSICGIGEERPCRLVCGFVFGTVELLTNHEAVHRDLDSVRKLLRTKRLLVRSCRGEVEPLERARPGARVERLTATDEDRAHQERGREHPRSRTTRDHPLECRSQIFNSSLGRCSLLFQAPQLHEVLPPYVLATKLPRGHTLRPRVSAALNAL